MEEQAKYVFQKREEISYDEMIGRLIDLRQREDDTRWKQGALCVYLIKRMTIKPATIAANLGCSEQHVRGMAKTFSAFPDEQEREKYAELSWYHFRVAASTTDPDYWIQIAAEQELSIRELKKLLAGETVKDELRDAERAWGKVIKLTEKEGPAAAWIEQQMVEHIQNKNR